MSNAENILQGISTLKDDEIPLASTALALASLYEGTGSVERYENHLKKISEAVGRECHILKEAGAADSGETQLAALKNVIVIQNGYSGDRDDYDNLNNASLIGVMDRRKGLPITLAILYIETARAQGWDIEGLDFPGHFLCRLQKDGHRLLFDPFNDAKILTAADLRNMVKTIKGPAAELSATFFEKASNRAMLMRLQNNIKYRLIEGEDYVNALRLVEIMRRIDVEEYRLLLDLGVLYARNNQPTASITALEEYLARVPSGIDRRDAENLLRDIRLTVN